MSHFTVLVVGDNIEKQLQPFHEFECTGTDDEYVQDVDVTAELQTKIDSGETITDALGWYGLDERVVGDESEINKASEHKYGYAVVKDGKLVKAVNRTNPNKQWDWWVLGGRWSNGLKLKEGATGVSGQPGLMGARFSDGPGRCDQARKGDIDWNGMRDEAGANAAALWDKIRAITGPMDDFIVWPKMRDELHAGNIDEARKSYHAQRARQAIAEASSTDRDLMWVELDGFVCSREEYIERARNSAGVTFAVLKGGEWFERGSMGWWGFVSDEKDAASWNREFAAMIDGLPDDTLLSVVDCHI